MRDDKPKRSARDKELFDDEKVRRAVKFRKPRLFDDDEFDARDIVMRHRNRKDNSEK